MLFVMKLQLFIFFIGDILSRYEIGKKLGEGSYGAVFEGIRLKDGLKVSFFYTYNI